MNIDYLGQKTQKAGLAQPPLFPPAFSAHLKLHLSKPSLCVIMQHMYTRRVGRNILKGVTSDICAFWVGFKSSWLDKDWIWMY